MNWLNYAVAGVVLCGCTAASLAQDGAPAPDRPLSLDELLKVADPAAEPMTGELDRLLASEQPGELYERAVLLMADASRRLGTAIARARTNPGEGVRSPEAGLRTQRVQEDVIRTLDALIAQMERDCPGEGCCPNGSANSGKPRTGAKPSEGCGAGACPNGSPSACTGCGRAIARGGSSGNGKAAGSGQPVGAGQPIAGAQPPGQPAAQDGAPKSGPGTCPGCGRPLNVGQAEGDGRRTSEPPPGLGAEFGAQVDPELLAWGGLPPRVREMVQQGSSDVYASIYQRLTEQYYMRLAQPMRPRSTREAVVPTGSGDRNP